MAEAYQVSVIKEGFWCIQEGHVRMFLIEGEDKALLIDTGNGTGDLKALVESLTKKPVELVITHAHPDHVGAAKQFAAAFIGEDEIDSYVHGPFACPDLKLTAVGEGYVFEVGEYKFEVIKAPGHTPGGIVLLDRAKKLLLSNDLVQDGPIFMIDPRSSSFEKFAETMRKFQAMGDDIETIYSSHYTLEMDKSFFKMLEEGATKMMNHELVGEANPMPMPMPAKVYSYEKVKFLSM